MPDKPMAIYLCDAEGSPIVTLPLTAEQYAAIAKEEARELPPQGFELSISAFVMPANPR